MTGRRVSELGLVIGIFMFSLVLWVSYSLACGMGNKHKNKGSVAPAAYMSPSILISAEELTEVKVKVEGMECDKCAKSIESEVSKIKGVVEVHADWEKGECHVKMKKDVKMESIFKAIEKAGFKPAGTI